MPIPKRSKDPRKTDYATTQDDGLKVLDHGAPNREVPIIGAGRSPIMKLE